MTPSIICTAKLKIAYLVYGFELLAVAAPRSVELEQNIFVWVIYNLVKILADDCLHGTLLLRHG